MLRAELDDAVGISEVNTWQGLRHGWVSKGWGTRNGFGELPAIMLWVELDDAVGTSEAGECTGVREGCIHRTMYFYAGSQPAVAHGELENVFSTLEVSRWHSTRIGITYDYSGEVNL